MDLIIIYLNHYFQYYFQGGPNELENENSICLSFSSSLRLSSSQTSSSSQSSSPPNQITNSIYVSYSINLSLQKKNISKTRQRGQRGGNFEIICLPLFFIVFEKIFSNSIDFIYIYPQNKYINIYKTNERKKIITQIMTII